MLAENLGDSSPRQHVHSSVVQEQPSAIEYKDHTDANGCAEPNVGMKKVCFFGVQIISRIPLLWTSYITCFLFVLAESKSDILETDEDYKSENEPVSFC